MLRIRSPSHLLSVVSRPAAGSSSRMTCGSAAQARAIDTSWRWPWLQVAGVAVAEVGDADEVERALHGAVAGVALHAERGGADVLLDGEVVVELELLERAGETAAHPLVRREPVDACAVERDRARGLGEAGDRVDGAGLAGTVGTDEADDAAGGHAQRDVGRPRRRRRTAP